MAVMQPRCNGFAAFDPTCPRAKPGPSVLAMSTYVMTDHVIGTRAFTTAVRRLANAIPDPHS